jgi:isocitrate dehydrogenase (NAD+)
MMLSSVLMLIHLKEMDAANRLQTAVEKVYSEHRHLTPDVGGNATTNQFTDAVVGAMG